MELVQGWKVALPDVRGTIAGGDTAAQEILWEGTHTGPLQAPGGTLEPSGAQIKVEASLWAGLTAGRCGTSTTVSRGLDDRAFELVPRAPGPVGDSSVLKESTKLSARALVERVADRADRRQAAVIVEQCGRPATFLDRDRFQEAGGRAPAALPIIRS